jgi:hypothetical protein
MYKEKLIGVAGDAKEVEALYSLISPKLYFRRR